MECILPKSLVEDDQRNGTWKELMVVENQIVLQVGFATKQKAPHQARCLKIDIDDMPQTFAHVTKGDAWFVAAVGGTSARKGDMQTVTVLKDLADKIAIVDQNEDEASADVDDQPETAVATMGEVQNGDQKDDPMHDLDDLGVSPPLETPKKNVKRCPKTLMKKYNKQQFPPRRTVIMPKRPPCVQCDAGLTKTVGMWVKSKNKAPHIKLEDID